MLSMLSPVSTFDLMDAVMADAMRIPLNSLPGCRIDTSPPRLEDKGTHYALALSAPGVAPSDLMIEANDDVLTIKGETVLTGFTHFVNHTITTPSDADADAATASSTDGLLVVTLPKKAAAAPKRIEVSSDAEETPETDAADAATRPYKITLVAAGLAAADVEVSVEKPGVLKVQGETKRTGAKISRCFRLPRDADACGASARHVDGILTVTVPKMPKAEPKSVAVAVDAAAPMAAAADPGAERAAAAPEAMDAETDKTAAQDTAAADEEDEDGVMV